MRKYSDKLRTNYFKVKDVDKLKKLAFEYGYELWEAEGGYFGLGEHDVDNIADMVEKDLEAFQDNLEDDQVVVSLEIGNEEIKHFSAYATVITKDNIQTFDLFCQVLDFLSQDIKDERNKQIHYQ